MTTDAEELTIEIPGFTIEALAWGEPEAPPVLSMHGWLDNAATMARLAPRIEGRRIVCFDFPGHGRSSHRPAGQSYHFVDLVPTIFDVADALEWETFSILAHSMGAAASLLAAGTRPDRIERMALIDGFGPWTTPAEEAPELLAEGLAERKTLLEKSNRTFPQPEAALRVIAEMYGLQEEEAEPLIDRGLVEGEEGGWRFSYDLQLRGRSLIRFTEPQVLAFLERATPPALLVRPTSGWPIDEELLRPRLDAVPDLRTVEVDGGHHVHLSDPASVAELVGPFLDGG